MSLLIEIIGRYLFKLVARKAIRSTGNAAFGNAVRLILVVLSLVLAAGIAVASAFLWTTDRLPQTQGLLQYAQSGGPPWVVAAPACAVLLVLLLLIPAQGRFGIALVLGAGTFGFTLAALANFQGGGQYNVSGTAVGSFGASALVMLVMLALAISDVPPLDSALAPATFLYSGRLGHLRALRDFGQQRGWEVSGPSGRQSTLTLDGDYDPKHHVTVTSALDLMAGFRSSASLILSIKMQSPADIIAFRISYAALPRRVVASLPHGEVRGRGGRKISYFLQPRPEEASAITESFMARLAEVVEAGQPYLRSPRDFVHATPFGLRFTHLPSYRLSRDDAELEPTLRWMRDLIGVLEPVSLTPAYAPQDSDAGTIYGGFGG